MTKMIRWFVTFCLAALPMLTFCQKLSVYGYVRDSLTKEPLIGANVVNTKKGTGVSTNSYGYYSIPFSEGDSVALAFSFVGYNQSNYSSVIKNNIQINISLIVGNTIDEVQIVGNQSVDKNRMSLVQIPASKIKLMPAILGEVDALRVFQLMPGVGSGKEGTSSIYVRGGGSDQNLFLLDGVPLYNVSHIGGFLSVFDTEAINGVKLYKGGFPARFGGRLSSVVDIRMKQGGMGKTNSNLTIGTLSSRFSIEGPIKGDTSSYFLSLRRCNVDLFTRAFSLLDSDGTTMGGYTFYDIYGTFNRKLSEKGRVYFSLYFGRDIVFARVNQELQNSTQGQFKLRTNIKWGNAMASVRYNRIVSPTLFSNLTIAYSGYAYNTTFKSTWGDRGSNTSELLFKSGINDFTSKLDFDYNPSSKHKVKFGAAGIFHIFNPGVADYSGVLSQSSNQASGDTQNQKAFEANAYIEDEISISRTITLNAGVHTSSYLISGQSSFQSLQPRLFASFAVNQRNSIKASYAEMRQFVHLLSLSGASLPADLWIPASADLPPEKSKQVALGYTYNIPSKGNYELNIEAFYKTMNNLIEYKEGTTFFGGNQNFKEKVESNGTGEVYGIELLLEKTKGKLTGWIGYTWSKNNRLFQGINKGVSFPFKYDKRHDFSFVLMYNFNNNFRVSGTWVYSTGSPITLAQNHYTISGLGYPDNYQPNYDVHFYNGRNNFRMPAYHRLDVSFDFQKMLNKGVRTWKVGVYNLYSRQNPFFLFYNIDKKDSKLKLYQLSLFPFLPSISYNYCF